MKGRIRPATLAAFAVAIFCTSLSAASSAYAACRGALQPPSRSNLKVEANATLCLVNQLRRTHHLRPLRMNSALNSVAAGQSYDMLVGGYFGDDSLSGLTPMQRVEASAYGHGSARLLVAQNIAWGEEGGSAPGAIIASWLGSAPHREILLASTYENVGVGISLGVPDSTNRNAGAIYTIDLAAK
jgi:uncharacterized protein YkwD